MDISLPEGLRGREELIVTEELTAERMGSGEAAVFATPAMIALMEKTCLRVVRPHLPEGRSTVGTLVNVTHERATAAGRRVFCEAKLAAVDGRRLVFEVEAKDEGGVIGRGRHERFIVDTERFMAKAEGR